MRALDMWRIVGDQAELESPDLAATVELDQPSLLIRRIGTTQISNARVLSVAACNECRHDSYVRGVDLVATYLLPNEMRTQLYWRYLPHSEDGTGIELIVSVQPNEGRLSASLAIDSFVEERAGSSHPSDLQFNGCSVWRLSQELAYVEMTHPGNGGDGTDQGHQLFAEELEKGVIRRARIRALVAAGHLPEEELRKCVDKWQRAFDDSELPLTT